MYVLIGGVERKINRVESYVLTSKKDETVGEILTNSRAKKLIEKEYKKKTIQDIIKFSQGVSDEVEMVEIKNPKNLDVVVGAAELAKSIEYDFAKQASSFGDKTIVSKYPDYDF